MDCRCLRPITAAALYLLMNPILYTERHKSHGATTIAEDGLNEVEFVYFLFKQSQSLLQKDFYLRRR